MNGKIKKIISLLLCLIMLSGTLSVCAYGEEKAALSKLHTEKSCIVDENGRTVSLRGVNLGGWLVFEEWFCPIDDGKSENELAGSEIYEILVDRFGEDGAKELLNTYMDNWITADDLDYIASTGMNCVRVPFWYRNFQDENGNWILNENGEPDFSRLDWIVEECGKRGLYVILDLHGAPGYQNDAHHSGKVKGSHLYESDAQGREYRKRTVELWEKIAEHFKGNSTVAAYDLLNEPCCDMNENLYFQKMWNLYDRLYKAVRKIDSETIMIMEAIWWLDRLPDPLAYGWNDVMYEVHLYDYTKENIDRNAEDLEKYSERYNIPLYVGEMNSGECYGYALNSYSEKGANWTTWTYKGISKDPKSTWFMRIGTCEKADIGNDSFDEIKEKWSRPIRSENFSDNESLLATLKSAVALDVRQSDGKDKTKYIFYVTRRLFLNLYARLYAMILKIQNLHK
ncbi:MAG: glycoside hydrolase family 5 protein [Acutalibacteraceae bacterium]